MISISSWFWSRHNCCVLMTLSYCGCGSWLSRCSWIGGALEYELHQSCPKLGKGCKSFAPELCIGWGYSMCVIGWWEREICEFWRDNIHNTWKVGPPTSKTFNNMWILSYLMRKYDTVIYMRCLSTPQE